MPRVPSIPVYGSPQRGSGSEPGGLTDAPNTLPGVRVGGQASPSAFGVPVQADLSGVEKEAKDIYEQQRQHADQVAVLSADNQLTDLRAQLLYHPETGILAQRGLNALNASQGLRGKWEAGVGQIQQGLVTPTQKDAFSRIATNQWATASEEVERHVAAQVQDVDHQAVSGSLDRSFTEAVRNADDPVAVGNAIAKSQAVATDWAKRQGMSPEETADTLAKVTSRIHSGVVEQLLTSGQDLTAQSYFQAHRDEFTATDLLQAERQVGIGSVRAASQQQADTILQSATTLDAAMRGASQIQDPSVRQATEQRLRQAFSDKAASDRDARNQAFQRASQVIMQGGTVQQIAPADRLLLSPDEYDQLDRTSARMRNPTVTTAPSYFTHWSQTASLHPQEFLSHDFGADRVAGKISEEDFRHFVNLQRTLQSHAETQDTSQRRREEAGVIRQSVAATKFDATASAGALSVPNFSALPDSVKQKILAGMGTRPRVTVPRWMVDSAQATPEYLDHLRLSGVDVDGMLAAPKGQGPVTLPPPKVPGAPIARP